MELKDDGTINAFSLYLNKLKQDRKVTDAIIAEKMGVDAKTVNRYMNMHKAGEWRPKRGLADERYQDLLSYFGVEHADFEKYRAELHLHATQEANTEAPSQSQSSGSGAMHIGSIQIGGDARFVNSPIASQNVSYHFSGGANAKDEEK